MDFLATIAMTINGRMCDATVETRELLVDVIRNQFALTGTHVGCEHGVCGACTVILNGATVRSCLMFAVQADGSEILTVEGLESAGELHPIQEAFITANGFQCGFCTPGILLTVYELLSSGHVIRNRDIIESLGGHLCRCTGYQQVLEATQLAAARLSVTIATEGLRGG
jgi:aerobic-type carbon monoxide dehydrogenase small subunit (CoxS/CutS family)